MRYLTRTIVALVISAMLLPSISMGEEVHYPFVPEVGTKWAVTEVRTVRTNRKGKPPESIGRVTGTLRVVSENDTGYVLAWTTMGIEAGGAKLGRERPDLFIGVPMSFHADFEGRPTAIDDVEALIDDVMGVVGEFPERERDEKILEAVKNTLLTTNRSTLAAMLLPQVTLFSNCHNFSLEPNSPVSVTGATSMFGGAPSIVTNLTVEMTFVGSADEPARVTTTETLDPSSAAEAVAHLFRSMAGRDGGVSPEKIPDLDAETLTECAIDTSTGEAVSVRMEKRVKSFGTYMVDIRDISIERIN